MALPNLTVTARLVDNPECFPAPSGTPIAKLRLAANARRKNQQTGEWEDGDTWFGRATAFGRTAEAIAEAGLAKGDLVTVRGRLKTTQWQDRDSGGNRSADELLIDDIARTLTPPRQQNNGAGFGNAPAADGYGQQTGGFNSGQAPTDDPWGAGGRPGFHEGAGAGGEPPF